MKLHALLLAAAATALARKCTELIIPVTISARNVLFGKQKVPATNYDVTSFTLNLTEAGVNYTDVVATGVSILQRPCKRKKNCKRSRNQLVSNHSWQLLPRSNLLPARQRTEQDAPDPHPRHRRRPQLLGPAHQQL